MLPGVHVYANRPCWSSCLIQTCSSRQLTAEQQLAAAKAALVTTQTALETQRLTEASQLATVVSDSADAARNAAMLDALDKKGFAGGHGAGEGARQGAGARLSRLATERDQSACLDRVRQTSSSCCSSRRSSGCRRSPSSRKTAWRQCAWSPATAGSCRSGRSTSANGSCRARCSPRSPSPGSSRRCSTCRRRRSSTSRSGPEVVISRYAQWRRARSSRARGAGGTERHGRGGGDRSPGTLPAGARADLSVDGTIEVERLENVLYVGGRRSRRTT